MCSVFQSANILVKIDSVVSHALIFPSFVSSTYLTSIFCQYDFHIFIKLLIMLNRLRRARLKIIKNLQVFFLITLKCALLNLENIEILYNTLQFSSSCLSSKFMFIPSSVFWKAVLSDRGKQNHRRYWSSKYFSLPLSSCEHGIFLVYLLLIRVVFN